MLPLLPRLLGSQFFKAHLQLGSIPILILILIRIRILTLTLISRAQGQQAARAAQRAQGRLARRAVARGGRRRDAACCTLRPTRYKLCAVPATRCQCADYKLQVGGAILRPAQGTCTSLAVASSALKHAQITDNVLAAAGVAVQRLGGWSQAHARPRARARVTRSMRMRMFMCM